MPRFKKKPVEIEAVQFTGSNHNEIIEFTGGQAFIGGPGSMDRGDIMTIQGIEGPHLASAGDWIICGVAGEFYPCKPEIFAETYTKVGD